MWSRFTAYAHRIFCCLISSKNHVLIIFTNVASFFGFDTSCLPQAFIQVVHSIHSLFQLEKSYSCIHRTHQCEHNYLVFRSIHLSSKCTSRCRTSSDTPLNSIFKYDTCFLRKWRSAVSTVCCRLKILHIFALHTPKARIYIF